MNKKINIRIDDNGSAFLLVINNAAEQRFVISSHSTLGDAWRAIKWLYQIESQEFTVGRKEIPVETWINGMEAAGYIE